MDFSQTLQYISKSADRDLLIDELNQVLDSLYGKKKDGLKQVAEHVSYPFKDMIVHLSKAHEIADHDIVKLQELLRSYIEFLQDLTTIRLTLGYHFKEKEMREIYSWFLANVKKKVLLDITVNPDILGGAIVETNGFYKDYSLKRKLESLKVQ